jgi:hypothetical protein
MNITEQLGTFAIDVAQEHQQDIFELEDSIDQIVDGLMGEDVSIQIWDGLAIVRETLDRMQFRAAITPSLLHKFAPNTHRSMGVEVEKLLVEELDLE